MHRNIDQVRDQREERKEMHKIIDRKRNKEARRRTQLSSYEKTETRRRYRNIRYNLKYQKKLLSTFATDTGFDVICSICLEYKSLQYCKPVSTLSKERKFHSKKKCSLLKNYDTVAELAILVPFL